MKVALLVSNCQKFEECTVSQFQFVGTLSELFTEGHTINFNKITNVVHILRNFVNQKFWSLGTFWKILGSLFPG